MAITAKNAVTVPIVLGAAATGSRFMLLSPSIGNA